MKKNLHQRKPRKVVTRKTVKPVGKRKTTFATWRQLHGTYLQLSEVLTAALETRHLAGNTELINSLSNDQRKDLVSKLTNVLESVKTYTERLDVIYAKHKTYTSDKDTPEDMFDMLAISNEYQTWLNDWTDNVANTILLDVLNYTNGTTFREITIDHTTS